MRIFFYLTLANIFLMSCGDSESKYISSINNKTEFKIVVQYSVDSTIVCLPNQETIIEDSWGSSGKEMSCMSPYFFKKNIAKVIVDDGNKILTKDISDDNNWSCNGDKETSLIMVGEFYSEIRSSFTVNNVDIIDAE